MMRAGRRFNRYMGPVSPKVTASSSIVTHHPSTQSDHSAPSRYDSPVDPTGGVTTTAEPAEADSENWYILPITDPAEKVERLTEDGIPSHDITKQFGKRQAIAFLASDVNKVLDSLDKQSREYMLEPSNINNMLIMTFTDGETEYTKPPQADHFEAWGDLIPVIKGAYKTFGVRLILDNPHCSPKAPLPSPGDEVLYVHFWSTPRASSGRKLKEVLGYTLKDGQHDGLEPTGLGVCLRDDHGTPFAEYLNGNLYILFDLPHGGGNVTELFASIMRRFFAFKDKAEEELTEFWNSIVYGAGIDGTLAKDLFIKSCSKLYEKNLSQMEETLKEYETSIEKHTVEVVKTTRDKEILLMKLEPLRNSTEERRKWASNEYDILCASPHVKKVTVKGKTIQVYTDMISITHHFHTYNIGEFRVDINTDGRDYGVKAFNLTNTYDNQLAHPHIKASGYCCLGNIQDGVTKLLAEYQYVILAQLMITYLQSYNPDSAYGRIDLWS